MAPVPDTRIYVYPTAGQSEAQLERDRCVPCVGRQADRFRSSSPQVAPHQRVQVVAGPPPGSDAVAGAATGAILGAVVSGPHDSGPGMLLGAIAGAIVGSAADDANAHQAAEHQPPRSFFNLEQQAGNYRRAMGACLRAAIDQVSAAPRAACPPEEPS